MDAKMAGPRLLKFVTVNPFDGISILKMCFSVVCCVYIQGKKEAELLRRQSIISGMYASHTSVMDTKAALARGHPSTHQ